MSLPCYELFAGLLVIGELPQFTKIFKRNRKLNGFAKYYVQDGATIHICSDEAIIKLDFVRIGKSPILIKRFAEQIVILGGRIQ
jgi:hypothetical protein